MAVRDENTAATRHSIENDRPQTGAESAPVPPPGVTVTPVTAKELAATLRHLAGASAPFFRPEGPLAAPGRHRDAALRELTQLSEELPGGYR
jgi:hypothetical protein